MKKGAGTYHYRLKQQEASGSIFVDTGKTFWASIVDKTGGPDTAGESFSIMQVSVEIRIRNFVNVDTGNRLIDESNGDIYVLNAVMRDFANNEIVCLAERRTWGITS